MHGETVAHVKASEVSGGSWARIQKLAEGLAGASGELLPPLPRLGELASIVAAVI